MKRTTARALSVATTLAVAGVVAGTGTLSSAVSASPAVVPASYSVTPATYNDSAALVSGTASRGTFAERASRDAAARTTAHLNELRASKAKAARIKSAKVSRATAVRSRRAANNPAATTRGGYVYTRPVAPGSARAIGKQLAASRGWTGNQWAALDRLWGAESGWTVTAGNGSGAYGIPQALPGSKMGSAGTNWRTDARTQIAWGLNYIAGRWGSPANAWAHFQSNRWY